MILSQFSCEVICRRSIFENQKNNAKTAGNDHIWPHSFSNFPCWRMFGDRGDHLLHGAKHSPLVLVSWSWWGKGNMAPETFDVLGWPGVLIPACSRTAGIRSKNWPCYFQISSRATCHLNLSSGFDLDREKLSPSLWKIDDFRDQNWKIPEPWKSIIIHYRIMPDISKQWV